jgi:hypothetical protein
MPATLLPNLSQFIQVFYIYVGPTRLSYQDMI